MDINVFQIENFHISKVQAILFSLFISVLLVIIFITIKNYIEHFSNDSKKRPQTKINSDNNYRNTNVKNQYKTQSSINLKSIFEKYGEVTFYFLSVSFLSFALFTSDNETYFFNIAKFQFESTIVILSLSFINSFSEIPEKIKSKITYAASAEGFSKIINEKPDFKTDEAKLKKIIDLAEQLTQPKNFRIIKTALSVLILLFFLKDDLSTLPWFSGNLIETFYFIIVVTFLIYSCFRIYNFPIEFHNFIKIRLNKIKQLILPSLLLIPVFIIFSLILGNTNDSLNGELIPFIIFNSLMAFTSYKILTT